MKVHNRSVIVIVITFAFMVYGITAFAGLSCSDLAFQPYGGATINSATIVAADGSTPAYCKIAATAGFQTDIEVFRTTGKNATCI
jgi:hypothetical protein